MQPLLDILDSEPHNFSNFVVGQNHAAYLATLAWSTSNEKANGLSDCIYLWGDAGSGCSHLLMAASHQSSTVLVATNLSDNANVLINFPKPIHINNPKCDAITPFQKIAIDGVQNTHHNHHSELFRILRVAEAKNCQILITGNDSPRHLQLPAEISSRIGKMQIFQLTRLSDNEKIAAMQYHAKKRGMTIETNVLAFFLQKVDRDMRILTALITAFDVWCLQQKCAASLPMARRMLANKAHH